MHVYQILTLKKKLHKIDYKLIIIIIIIIILLSTNCVTVININTIAFTIIKSISMLSTCRHVHYN